MLPRAGEFLPHFKPLRPRALGRIDAGERHAAEDERINGELELRAGHEAARGDAAAMID